ncbi:MAG: hypothetical protein VYB54_08690 [Pseudomonadota bacterium]|nr:hypothetical protein [Pseudomonadota bacterium]
MSNKFLFDQSFDEPGQSWAERRRKQQEETFTRDDVEAARAEGYDEGRAAGHVEAGGDIEAASATALGLIASALQDCRDELESVTRRQSREAAQIALAVGRRLARRLMARYPDGEIEALVMECLGELREEPRIVVRTAEEVADRIRDRIDTMAAGAGFTGRVVLMPDDHMGAQDCRVEWADGGAARDMKAVEAAISAAVDRFLAADDTAESVVE